MPVAPLAAGPGGTQPGAAGHSKPEDPRRGRLGPGAGTTHGASSGRSRVPKPELDCPARVGTSLGAREAGHRRSAGRARTDHAGHVPCIAIISPVCGCRVTERHLYSPISRDSPWPWPRPFTPQSSEPTASSAWAWAQPEAEAASLRSTCRYGPCLGDPARLAQPPQVAPVLIGTATANWCPRHLLIGRLGAGRRRSHGLVNGR